MKFEVKMTIEVPQGDLFVYMLKNSIFDNEIDALCNEIEMHMLNSEEIPVTACTVKNVEF